MKVILTKDVYKHGVAGEVVTVADGFARNYLIPQGLAAKATQGALKQAGKLREAAAARRALVYNEMKGIAEQVEGVELFFAVKAGATGKLYGSITMGDVAEALNEKLGLEIDRRRIGNGQSLRELGKHSVAVRLGADLTPKVNVIVHREGESPEDLKAAVDATEETTAPVAEPVAVEEASSPETAETEEETEE